MHYTTDQIKIALFQKNYEIFVDNNYQLRTNVWKEKDVLPVHGILKPADYSPFRIGKILTKDIFQEIISFIFGTSYKKTDTHYLLELQNYGLIGKSISSSIKTFWSYMIDDATMVNVFETSARRAGADDICIAYIFSLPYKKNGKNTLIVKDEKRRFFISKKNNRLGLLFVAGVFVFFGHQQLDTTSLIIALLVICITAACYFRYVSRKYSKKGINLQTGTSFTILDEKKQQSPIIIQNISFIDVMTQRQKKTAEKIAYTDMIFKSDEIIVLNHFKGVKKEFHPFGFDRSKESIKIAGINMYNDLIHSFEIRDDLILFWLNYNDHK